MNEKKIQKSGHEWEFIHLRCFFSNIAYPRSGKIQVSKNQQNEKCMTEIFFKRQKIAENEIKSKR